MQYVLVAINLPVRNLFKQFLYRAPADRPDLAAGWRVLVPFGRNEVEGFVVRTYTEDEARHRMEADGAKMGLEDIREVLAVLGEEPWFDAEMLATAHWLARYYMCTDAEAMRLFIPGKAACGGGPSIRTERPWPAPGKSASSRVPSCPTG